MEENWIVALLGLDGALEDWIVDDTLEILIVALLAQMVLQKIGLSHCWVQISLQKLDRKKRALL